MKAATLKLMLRHGLKPWLRSPVPIGLQRRLAAVGVAVNSRVARGVTVRREVLDGVPGEVLMPDGGARGALLYLHGGAFVLGSPAIYRALASRLALASGMAVHVPDYRLAPEHPNPAQLQDALRVYRALLASGVKRVAVAGDSAGGMLALRLLLALKERRLRRPEALALISPWTDFTLSGDSQRSHAARDPLLTASWLRQATFAFAGGMALPLPLLEADLSALPPTLIQVGSEEILLSDSERLAVRATTCGVPVTLRCYEGLWHDFQLHAGVFAPADAALDEMGGFLRAALDSRMSKAA